MSTIIGINFGHDGSVCLVKDGKLISAIATERITRKKKDFGFTEEVNIQGPAGKVQPRHWVGWQ